MVDDVIAGKKRVGKRELEDRVKDLEKRLNDLLKGKIELEVKPVSVAPRSKLRVACE